MNEVVRFLNENNYNNVKFNEPLSKHTTFRVGGEAAIVVTPESKEEIIKLVSFLNTNKIKHKVFGNGSNILPSDNYYDGVVIKTNKALNYVNIDDNIVTVGGGYPLVKLAHLMVNYELTGLEFLGGIPGTIGGAIYMNAGAYKREMKDVVINVTLLDDEGKIIVLNNEELKYGYRSSILQGLNNLLIIETKLQLEKGNKEDILNLLKVRKERRKESQPLEYPCAGSTFRNPLNTHAYLLIDEAGLRGFKLGGAQVSEKHCNFIINYNNAKAQDIKDLVDYIVKEVYEKTNVELKPEIELFNW